MLGGTLDTGREAQQVVLGPLAGGDDAGDGGPALRKGPGLVDNEGVDLLHTLERLGVLDQHA